MVRSARDLVEHVHHLIALFEDRGEVIVPGGFAESLHSFVVCFFSSGKLGSEMMRCSIIHLRIFVRPSNSSSNLSRSGDLYLS